MSQHPGLFTICILCAASFAWADPITYDVSVNTSSISGTSGSLDFQFNPGSLFSQSASLQILNFTSDGTLAGTPTLTGDVSGTLPDTLTFDNGSFFNDYFDGFTFGTTITFEVSLYGPALSSPDGTSTSGSAFAFSMFSDPAGTIPTLTSDLANGFAFTVAVNLDGTTTVTNASPETSVVPESSPTVPEPGSIALMGTATALLALLSQQRRAWSPRGRNLADASYNPTLMCQEPASQFPRQFA